MSFAIIAETALQYWEQLDCPVSLSLAIKARYGDWEGVLTHKVEPENFDCNFRYAKANAAVCFLKKNPEVPGTSAESRRSAAVATWKAGEALCYQANERLSRFLVSPLSDDTPSEFLRRVRRRLLEWLRHPPTDAEMQKFGRHGPGTTFSSEVANPTAADKYDAILTLTRGATWYIANVVGTKWGAILASRYKASSRDCLSFTRGNRFVTVPKTALTDRAIAIEATLNVHQQLAVGTTLKRRLKRYAGWDLRYAKPIHREMARRGSLDGSFATIDLSNASDSLSKNLVRVLLRDTGWLEVMEDLRSTHTFIDGRWHLLEKFSSMGNGYTFELESCVFAAIASVCLELKGHTGILGHDLFVFGDDIIVPSDTYELVTATLRWCGFEINMKKSFSSGSFRESCGGDFFSGAPVRGFYLKDTLAYGTQRVYTVHNGAKVSLRNCGVDSPWFLDWLRGSLLPERYRHIGGSERLGDSVLHGLPSRWRWEHGIRWVKAVQWNEPVTVRWSYYTPLAQLACRLNGYGHSRGIDCRGGRITGTVTWVTDS